VLVEPAFVFLTAFKTLSFEQYLCQNGVEECYEKPLEIDTLIQILKQHQD
jgi:hypothetical protein